MKVLLTNDDGIRADGLQALKNQLLETMHVIVVAPECEQSECGHSVTTRRALKVKTYAENEFSVDGTPADCVRMGLMHFASDCQIVISGINHGGNLGADTWMSGTVAAAREGYLRGRLSVAVSQVRRQDIADNWARSAQLALTAIQQTLESSSYAQGFWNINLPATDARSLPSVRQCELDPSPLPFTFSQDGEGYRHQGDYHNRPRSAGRDIDVCFGGCISVTKM